MPLELHLQGIIPSKKNNQVSIVNPKTQRPIHFPNSKYQSWEKQASTSFRVQANSANLFAPILTPCSVDICYQVKAKRSWDLTNKAEGIMDALVKANILQDDNRFIANDIRLRWSEAIEDGVKITLTY